MLLARVWQISPADINHLTMREVNAMWALLEEERAERERAERRG